MELKRTLQRAALGVVALFVLATSSLAADARTYHRTVAVDGVKIFYREAGDPKAPAVLLLHGFPSSSHMYRELIPLLADRYHVVAPDLPGFGFSDAPDRAQFKYSFEHVAQTMTRFTELTGLDHYAVYVFDYGAPVGFRMALAHPERIEAIVSQNGNVYEDGLAPSLARLKKAHLEPTEANRNELRSALLPAANQRRYFAGVSEADKPRVAPDGYALDDALLARPGMAELQLDLLVDYWSNVDQYPSYQAYLHSHKPPLLAIWGRNDTSFLPAGALAFRRDDPEAEVRLLDTGHFALETHVTEIAEAMRAFLARHVKQP
ncbi:MAG TPA: alpha/beta hydrolase [Burkholderiaceae bacterium]|nr:alpha/beta hydrolase [Burkholderiaceae bacterium]